MVTCGMWNWLKSWSLGSTLTNFSQFSSISFKYISKFSKKSKFLPKVTTPWPPLYFSTYLNSYPHNSILKNYYKQKFFHVLKTSWCDDALYIPRVFLSSSQKFSVSLQTLIVMWNMKARNSIELFIHYFLLYK
jgi:hypothetical protein